MGLQGLPPEHGTGRRQALDVPRAPEKGNGWGGDPSANQMGTDETRLLRKLMWDP